MHSQKSDNKQRSRSPLVSSMDIVPDKALSLSLSLSLARASCRLPPHGVSVHVLHANRLTSTPYRMCSLAIECVLLSCMLIALPPLPARFLPERDCACGAVLCCTPVGPSLSTEAKCRLALPTPGQPAEYLLKKIIDKSYTHRKKKFHRQIIYT